MPEVRDITVHVTTSEGVELPEWGVHTFRRNNKTSAYIQSKTDMSFRVSITPKIPYIPKDVASAHVYQTRKRGSDRPGFFKMEDEWEDMDEDGNNSYRPDDRFQSRGQSSSKQSASRTHRRSTSGHDSTDRQIKRESSDIATSLSSPPRPRKFDRTPPPPFHLLACMYLDGRSKAERRIVVYLDPDDDDFNKPDGRAQFKTRWVEGRDGKLREHAWMFKDVGIETVFDKMLLSGDHHVSGKVNMRDEDGIIAAMNAADLGAEGDVEREERTKLGQIVVTIERVKLGEKWVDNRFRAKHKEGEAHDIDMDGASNEITHTAGFGQAKALKFEGVRVVAYSPYRVGEGAYATFQFFYRSEEMLRKFNFPGFLPSQSVNRSRRHMNAKLSNLTPLGISHPLRPTTKPTNAKVTPFEETIKRDKIPETQPAEFVFDDGYREHGGMIKKEESVSPIEDKSFLESIPFSSESNSRNTSKIKDKGKEKEKEKENLRPDGAFGLSRTGRYTLRSNLLEDEVSNTSSQQSRTLSPAASQATSSGTGPPHQHPHQHPKPTLAKVTTEGPDFSVHASSTSRISLPDTESFTSLKSAEDGKPSTKDYRKPTFESDADDEFEASDKETHDGSDEGAVDDKEDEYAERDADDDGLHSAMNKIQLGKRSRGDDDDVGKDFGDFGMQPARPTEGLTLQMRDPREEERERDIAEENEVQSKEMDDAENAAPAKRRKGSDGQLVSAQNLGSQ